MFFEIKKHQKQKNDENEKTHDCKICGYHNFLLIFFYGGEGCVM